MTRQLVLCSTSRYRRDLLSRLQLPFDCAAPHVDESPLPEETAAALTERLAQAKTQVLAQRYPDALLIGSDQAASLDGHILGKPGSRERAFAQLQAASGHEVEFHTAVALLDTASGHHHSARDVTRVRFRVLTDRDIAHYLDRESALDCAGSFKCEGLGISLFDAIDSRDPTALVGLPLIATTRLLRSFELDPLG